MVVARAVNEEGGSNSFENEVNSIVAVASVREFSEFLLLHGDMDTFQLSTSVIHPLRSVHIPSICVFRSVDCQDPELSGIWNCPTLVFMGPIRSVRKMSESCWESIDGDVRSSRFHLALEPTHSVRWCSTAVAMLR